MKLADIEDAEALVAYLRATGHIVSDEQPEVRTLTGGVSNRTVLVRRPSGEAWVIKQALPKLRVAVEWLSSPERIAREGLGLRHVGAMLAPGAVPRVVFEDPHNYLLAMQAVPEPHDNWKRMLLDGEIDLSHVRQFAGMLAVLHGASSKRRAELMPIFDDRSYFESLRVEPYYLFSARQVPAAEPFLKTLVDETHGAREAVVHGDFSPKNVLVHLDRLVLLDYEVIHFGDPGFDIGFSLTHFLSKAHHLPAHLARFREAARAYWDAYSGAIAGLGWATPEHEARAARHTLGCLLARVAGRSPLEYLGADEKARQRDAALTLMSEPPARVADLIERFVELISMP